MMALVKPPVYRSPFDTLLRKFSLQQTSLLGYDGILDPSEGPTMAQGSSLGMCAPD